MNRVWRFLREVLVNIALPYAIYSWVQPRFGDVNGLLAASGPAIVWSVIEFARHRRADALSLLAPLGIGLSLAAFFGGGGVRFLQLREKLVTLFVALVFLGSAAIGKPLMYQLIRALLRRNKDTRLADVETLRDDKTFKRGMTFMTLVWGFGLLLDGALSIALVFALPIKTYLIVNPVLGYATIGGLTLWNIWYGSRMRRKRMSVLRGSPVARTSG
jgi:hypothetical protein